MTQKKIFYIIGIIVIYLIDLFTALPIKWSMDDYEMILNWFYTLKIVLEEVEVQRYIESMLVLIVCMEYGCLSVCGG